LIENVLLGVIYEDPPIDQWSGGVFNPELRAKGSDWPAKAHTMIGFERLGNIRALMRRSTTSMASAPTGAYLPKDRAAGSLA
jgi:O-methyltransferase/8-demethyl-8-(2,3-dimethoxy-alpha-L-rhamnosyl)tetracenomycin-C 4'-O-methyltransferase